MKSSILRRVRNACFIVLVGLMAAGYSGRVQASETWCSGTDDCDPGWCSDAFIACYNLTNSVFWGCYDAGLPCGCAWDCDVSN
jgi:hypothetical protein